MVVAAAQMPVLYLRAPDIILRRLSMSVWLHYKRLRDLKYAPVEIFHLLVFGNSQVFETQFRVLVDEEPDSAMDFKKAVQDENQINAVAVSISWKGSSQLVLTENRQKVMMTL